MVSQIFNTTLNLYQLCFQISLSYLNFHLFKKILNIIKYSRYTTLQNKNIILKNCE